MPPLDPAHRRRINLTKSQAPAFLDAVDETFGEDADAQHAALVAELRGEVDASARLLEALQRALPPEQQELLREFEQAWSIEALAREDAAYLIGALIGQTRPICVDCCADRHRAAVQASSWRQFSAPARLSDQRVQQ